MMCQVEENMSRWAVNVKCLRERPLDWVLDGYNSSMFTRFNSTVSLGIIAKSKILQSISVGFPEKNKIFAKHYRQQNKNAIIINRKIYKIDPWRGGWS